MNDKINMEEMESGVILITLDFPTIGTVQGNAIKKMLNNLVAQKKVKVILNLVNVRNANSFGLSLFFRMKNLLKENMGDLAIININDHMEELLKTAGLYDYFEIKDTKEKAVDYLMS